VGDTYYYFCIRLIPLIINIHIAPLPSYSGSDKISAAIAIVLISTTSMVQGGKIVKATRRPGEPLRVVFFTASYFVLDGVTLTLRKLLAYLKSIGAEVMVVTAAPLAAAGCAELGELDGENLVLVPGMPVPVENEVS